MPKNRYDNKLRQWNQVIIGLTPANDVLKIELALELKNRNRNKKDARVLDIGVGEGDLTLQILKYNKSVTIDCLDVSKEMLSKAEINLNEYQKQVNFICADGLEFLQKEASTYDFIVTTWTVHNFTWKDKLSILKAIYSSLKPTGALLFMDKVYPDSTAESNKLLKTQLKRFRYLPKNIQEVIATHEKKDAQDLYKMNEKNTSAALKKIGFKKINFLDRVERDILLVAEK